MDNALYGRQSIDKLDSVSIDTQLEYGRYEAHGEPCREYVDKGYSGKNTNRPAFEKMMEDIKSGQISKVIVYKLDRISRSILDFANMMAVFQQYNVEFVSSTEKFDTSTPIGRAMLNICIVFAQLERETIQKRVTDAYYSRCKRGFYMGGRIPYGFKLINTVIDNIKTSMYEPILEEAEQIALMYRLYSNPENSLGSIISYFDTHGIKNLRGSSWTSSRISEMLRNPVYVTADVSVYDFFKAQGANVVNPVSDFTNGNACYLYKGTTSTTRKQCDLTDKEIVLAPHKGIVSSHDWVKCRLRCLDNRQSTRTSKPKNSWLLGKMKCGKCGYSIRCVKAKTKKARYFICGMAAATKNVRCNGTGSDTIYADEVETYVFNAIKEKLADFATLSAKKTHNQSPKENKYRIRIKEIDIEINDLLSKVVGASAIVMAHINKRIESLDTEQKKLQMDMLAFTCQEQEDMLYSISNHVIKWDNVSFEDRQAVVDALIKVITIADNQIEIAWKI